MPILGVVLVAEEGFDHVSHVRVVFDEVLGERGGEEEDEARPGHDVGHVQRANKFLLTQLGILVGIGVREGVMGVWVGELCGAIVAVDVARLNRVVPQKFVLADDIITSKRSANQNAKRWRQVGNGGGTVDIPVVPVLSHVGFHNFHVALRRNQGTRRNERRSDAIVSHLVVQVCHIRLII